MTSSLCLYAGKLDHLGPLRGFVGDELAEVGGRARKRRAAQIDKARLDLASSKAAMAVAMIGPMPGTLASRWLTGLLLCQAMSCFSIAATAASSCSICAANTCSTWRAKSGSRMLTLRKPCGAHGRGYYERQNLRTPKLLAQNRRSLCGSHLLLIRSQQFGTQVPQGGHPPHHSITSSASASSAGGRSS